MSNKMTAPTIRLYGFWRSLAAFRVRVALNLKCLPFEEISVDLLQGEQYGAEFHSMNAQHAVPVLKHGYTVLTQSLPIIEYIDESWMSSPLLPSDAAGRARVRAIAHITASDVHPLLVPRVRNFLSQDLNVDEEGSARWARQWLNRGTEAIEAVLREGGSSSPYAHGNKVSLADIALVSHVIGVKLFAADLSKAPRLNQLADHCLSLDAFSKAHPFAQPGAPKNI